MKYVIEVLLSVVYLFSITLRTMAIKHVDSQSSRKTSKVLLLSSDFLPKINGGTYRPLSWLKYSSRDIIIDVVTSESNSSNVSEMLEKQIPANVKRFFVKNHLYIFRLARMFTDRPSFMIASYLFCRREYRKNKPDIIVATGPCFCSFIVAAALSNTFKCRLVLDYRDEWTDNPFEFVKPAYLDAFFEKLCLRRADLISFTTESQMNKLVKKYTIKNLAEKTIVIPNGFDVVEHNSPFDISSVSAYKTISFAGALAEHTDPGQFLSLLEDVCSEHNELAKILKVQFIGSKSDQVRTKLNKFKYSSCIIPIEQKSPEDLESLLNASNYLLLILDERFKRYMPGKIYEYIKFGKPILVVGVGACSPDYEIFKILKKYSDSYFISTPSDLIAALKHSTTPDALLNDEFKNKFNREFLANVFWQSLDGL